jgi:hypothetical protein
VGAIEQSNGDIVMVAQVDFVPFAFAAPNESCGVAKKRIQFWNKFVVAAVNSNRVQLS